jgi:transitional endoplasmic reticulum ATPase
MKRYRLSNMGDVVSATQGGLRQAFRCAVNVAQSVDRRRPEASALAGWLDQDRASLGLVDGEDFGNGTLQKIGVSAVSWRRVRMTVARCLRTAPVSVDTPAELWLDVLADRLGFDELDRQLLALVLYYELDDRLEHLVDRISAARGGMSQLRCDVTLIALLLDDEPGAIETRLHAEGRLCASGLLRVSRDGDLDVINQLGTLVRNAVAPKQDPFEQLLGRTIPPTLPWDAFAHLGREAEIAAALLTASVASREPGVNILLYGPPGTGKTSFAATLAARVGAGLRPITEQDRIGGEPNRHERLSGLQLAQRLAPPGETVLLFDEAEDVFIQRSFVDGEPVISSRVFMHRLLEQASVPVIWTANDIGILGPAVLRRMTMCLALTIPGIAVRTRLWRSMGAAEGIALSEADANRLARLVPAAPAVAATALRAIRLAGGDAGTAQLIVAGIARAIGGGRAPAPVAERASGYDPALVNADQDLEALADIVARPGAPAAVSFLLSGPPGTGKSVWVRYLADRMGLEVLQKRASDLLGPFVGETEANIAAAFAEARESGAFLIFDEADSLLGDRNGAVRSWEVSQVNEMLTWMEQHPLPFACTTNLPDRLDPASLRRFLVKLRFSWLTTAQAQIAFRQFFGAVPPSGLDELRTLTPADFALVRRRVLLTGREDNQGVLLRLLAAECEGRRDACLPIGFRVGG